MQKQNFSVKQARTLVDLCVSAETSGQPLLVEEQGGELYAAFRASGDPVGQSTEPLNAHGTKSPQGIRFGRGTGYGPLVEAYLDAAAGKLDALAGKRVWLTGHGIGGVFALLAAAELLVEGGDIAAVYTFGAPRVGDSQLVNALACPIYRVVNNLDVMVTIPPPWRWRHAGKQILINADGSLNLNPNPVNRLPSLVRQTVWLGEMLMQGLSSGYPRALQTLLNQVLADHALESYRNRIHALSE